MEKKKKEKKKENHCSKIILKIDVKICKVLGDQAKFIINVIVISLLK